MATAPVFKITRIERTGHTANGNPKMRIGLVNVATDEHSNHATMSDAGFVYGIENPEYRDTPVAVDFTNTGRIRSIKLV